MQVREELSKLLKLQEFDIRASEARKILKVAPFFLKPLNEELIELESIIANQDEEIVSLNKKILDLENAVKSDAIYADSMESKLPNVLHDHKEYHFTSKNIDKLRKLGRDRKEEIAGHQEKLDKRMAASVERLKQKEELISQITARSSEVEGQIKDAQDEIASIKAEKEKYLPEISAPLLSKYDRLVTAYGHGIGVVKDKRCASCDVLLPAQTYNLLQRGEEFLHCPNCQRLLLLL